MKMIGFMVLTALLLTGCAKPPPVPELRIEVRGKPQAPLYYIAGEAVNSKLLAKIVSRAKTVDANVYVAIYTELPDAPSAIREVMKLCQDNGYKRIDIRLERLPPLAPVSPHPDRIY